MAANTQIDLFDDFFASTTPKQTTIKQSPRKPVSQRSSFDDNNPFPEFSSPIKPLPPSSKPIPEEPEEEEDFAPAATEMRKHLASKSQSKPPESDGSDGPTTPTKDAKKGKKRTTPDDEVILAARERKRVALEQSRIAAEELAAAVKDHGHLRNLGDVEMFSVDLSITRSNVREDRSARWDPAWNGRKNFKKFRKAKQSVSVGLGREMIQLVDYKGKSAASQGMAIKPIELMVEFFFAPVERGPSQQNRRNANGHEPSSDDFALDLSPAKSGRSQTSHRGSTASQRNSNRGSNRSSRRTLFIQDDASDNDLGFDSS